MFQKKLNKRFLTIFCLILFPSYPKSTYGCANIGKNTGATAASHLKSAIQTSSYLLTQSINKSASEVLNSVKLAVSSLTQISSDISTSVSKGAYELGRTVRFSAQELSKIAKSLESTMQKSVEELAEVLKIATTTIQKITERLAVSIDNAVEEIGATLRHAMNRLYMITQELTRSVEKGVEEIGKTIRHLADKIADLAKQVSIRVDSGDLANIGEGATQNLKDALIELSKNWDLALNTADLKDFGESAARQLSEALQNINVKLELYIRIDDNTLTAIGYISIAGGFAFSVLLIAILISIKQCRKCTVSLFSVCLEGCRSNSDSGNRSASPEDQEMHSLQIIKKNDYSQNNLNSQEDHQQNDKIKDKFDKKNFKRLSKKEIRDRESLLAYKENETFSNVQKFWTTNEL